MKMIQKILIKVLNVHGKRHHIAEAKLLDFMHQNGIGA